MSPLVSEKVRCFGVACLKREPRGNNSVPHGPGREGPTTADAYVRHIVELLDRKRPINGRASWVRTAYLGARVERKCRAATSSWRHAGVANQVHWNAREVASGLSRSNHYQSPRLLLRSPKRTLAHSIAAFGHRQHRPAASAVTNSLRQATSVLSHK